MRAVCSVLCSIASGTSSSVRAHDVDACQLRLLTRRSVFSLPLSHPAILFLQRTKLSSLISFAMADAWTLHSLLHRIHVDLGAAHYAESYDEGCVVRERERERGTRRDARKRERVTRGAGGWVGSWARKRDAERKHRPLLSSIAFLDLLERC